MTRTLSYLLLGCIIVGSLLGWPNLPDRMPAQFGLDGEVTRWTDRSALQWFALPLLAILLALAIGWIARAVPGRAHLLNIPDKARYLSLDSEHRQPVIGRMQTTLYGVSAQLLALLALFQIGIYRTAIGHGTESYMRGVIVVSLIFVPVMLFLWLPWVRSEIERQWRAQQGEHGRAR